MSEGIDRPLLDSSFSSEDGSESIMDSVNNDHNTSETGHQKMNVEKVGFVNGKEKMTCYMYCLTFLSAIGGFLFGYDTGVISGAMLFLKDIFKLSTVWQEMIVSITIAAAALFALIGGFATDFFGRRKVILCASIIFTIGSLVLGCSRGKISLLIGRFIVGMGVGLASMSVPIYIAECAPAHIRGRLVTCYQLSITTGLLIASLLDGAFSYDHDNGWRYMLGLAGVPSLIQMIGFFFMPETPRWLVSHGYIERARISLQKIRGNLDVEEELEAIQGDYEDQVLISESGETSGSKLIQALRVGPVRRAILVGCGLQLFQQICGINTVMYYSATIITMSGVQDPTTAIWLASVTAFINFVFTFVGVYLVERIGRRPLILGSIIGTFFSLVVLGIAFQLAAYKAPDITEHPTFFNVSDKHCMAYSNCNNCILDESCGYCYSDERIGLSESSCLPVGELSDIIETDYSLVGNCTKENLENSSHLVWAYDYCPTNVSWLALLGLILYLASFAPGMGPMPWTINSEIYPLWARSTGSSLATATNWIFNLIISMTFLTLTEVLTRYGAFYLYSGFALLGIIFISVLLPETKGRSLEEMETLFLKPWSSC